MFKVMEYMSNNFLEVEGVWIHIYC